MFINQSSPHIHDICGVITMTRKIFYNMLQLIIILLGISVFSPINIVALDVIGTNVQADVEVTKEKLEMIPFFWTVGVIGGVIGLTLAYVSWRKYKAEKRKQFKSPND